MKFGFAPSPFVMSISSIEHPAFTLFPHPGPGLPVIPLYPFHEDGHVIIEVTMDVSFVPSFKFSDTCHHRMVCIDDIYGEVSLPVRFELPTNCFYKPNGIPKAK